MALVDFTTVFEVKEVVNSDGRKFGPGAENNLSADDERSEGNSA
jgi:hypothetical protein